MSQLPKTHPKSADQSNLSITLDEDNTSTMTNRKPTTTSNMASNNDDDTLTPLIPPKNEDGKPSTPKAVTKTDIPPTTALRQRVQRLADGNGPDNEQGMGEGMKLLQTIFVLVLFVLLFEWLMAFWRHTPKSDQQVIDEYLRDNPLCPPGVKCEF